MAAGRWHVAGGRWQGCARYASATWKCCKFLLLLLLLLQQDKQTNNKSDQSDSRATLIEVCWTKSCLHGPHFPSWWHNHAHQLPPIPSVSITLLGSTWPHSACRCKTDKPNKKSNMNWILNAMLRRLCSQRIRVYQTLPENTLYFVKRVY